MKSFKALFVEFTDESTIHGIKKACRSKSITLRVLWTILLLASTCLFSYQISRLVEKYHRYQINVKTTEERLPLVHPTIKICNLTPVPIMYFGYEDGNILKYIKTLAIIKDIPVDGIEIDFLKNLYTYEAFDITSEEELYDEYRRYMFELFSNKSKSKSFFDTSIGDVGIIEVKVDGQKISDHKTEYDADFGLCITMLTKEIKLKPTNRQSGIEIMFYVGQKDYIPLFVSSAGYRVGLAEFGSDPDMTRSFLVPPGFKTEIAIQQVISYRLSAPYGECYNGSEYQSISACQQICLEEKVYKACKCSLHGKIGQSSNLCRANDECVLKIIDCKNSCTDACLEPCRRHNYDVTPSYTQYPADTYLPIVDKALRDFDTNNNISMEELRRNSAALRVYFRRGTTVITEEHPAYSFENLMSDIGGQLSLGLGVSVLSMLELIGFIIDIVHSFLSKDTAKEQSNIKMNTAVDQAADKPI